MNNTDVMKDIMKKLKNKVYVLLGFEPEEDKEEEMVPVRVYNN